MKRELCLGIMMECVSLIADDQRRKLWSLLEVEKQQNALVEVAVVLGSRDRECECLEERLGVVAYGDVAALVGRCPGVARQVASRRSIQLQLVGYYYSLLNTLLGPRLLFPSFPL